MKEHSTMLQWPYPSDPFFMKASANPTLLFNPQKVAIKVENKDQNGSSLLSKSLQKRDLQHSQLSHEVPSVCMELQVQIKQEQPMETVEESLTNFKIDVTPTDNDYPAKIVTNEEFSEKEDNNKKEDKKRPLNLLDEDQIHFSRVSNNLHLDKLSRSLFCGDASSPRSALSSSASSILEPNSKSTNPLSLSLPLAFSLDKLNLSDSPRPAGDLLQYLNRDPATPPSPPPCFSFSTPSSPVQLQSPRTSLSSSVPIYTPLSPLPLVRPSPPLVPQSQPCNPLMTTITINPPSHSIPNPSMPITPVPPHRPRRANDYTGEFKREFCALLGHHPEARSQWEHFWRRRECTGRRPCIKSYLAFCDLFPEFMRLKKIHKFRILGTRTVCECGPNTISISPMSAISVSSAFSGMSPTPLSSSGGVRFTPY